MRKRCFWIVLAAFLVAGFTLFLLPRKPDGLDFIRKYRPRDERLYTYASHVVVSGSTPPTMLWAKEFSFDSLPPALIKEMEQKVVVPYEVDWDHTSLPDKSMMYWNEGLAKVWIQLATEPSWLERQWFAFRNRFFPPPPQPDQLLIADGPTSNLP